ncbi:MAG TPA: hypothetical protein VI306_09295 [Pyrinomonadaceae bacterium]
MGYTDPTLKKLFALSGNQCAFPECEAPIVDAASGIIVGEICHIKARSPKGQDTTQVRQTKNAMGMTIYC